MLKDRLNRLFTKYDPDIQAVISEVLTLEQEHISRKNPHVKEPIDQIITRLANKKLKQVSEDKD
jgi:hypothetical protein